MAKQNREVLFRSIRYYRYYYRQVNDVIYAVFTRTRESLLVPTALAEFRLPNSIIGADSANDGLMTVTKNLCFIHRAF
jgi:hypothetical protein